MTELRQLQLYKLNILKEFAGFCDRNNLHYYIYAGTLLGAVRHKGFIPWDDDIDVCMLWDDYYRFLEVAPKKFGEQFFIQNYRTDKAFNSLWTQIRANNTTSMIMEYKALPIHWGVCIDVFPLISMEKDERKYARQLNAFHLAKSLLAKDAMRAKKEKATGLQRLLNLTPRAIRHWIVSRIFMKYASISEDDEWLGGLDSAELKRKYKLEDFQRAKEYEFEGAFFFGPQNADSVLICNYGADYMTPPPIEKRGGHELPLGEIINDLERDYSYYQQTST